MDFALSSSTVLGAAVLVWLLWVAPYFLRRRAAEQPAGEAALLMESMEPLRREATPSSSSGTGGSSAAPRAEGRLPGGAPKPRLRVRWGRLAVALTGLCALVAAVVTLVLMIVGVPAWVPLACLATAVGSVALLRSLAVRDRKRRMDRAFGAAMGAPAPRPAAPARTVTPSEVFDAGREPAPAPRPVSREELRAIALDVAKASQASAEEAARASGEQAPGWEPVEVPRPAYLDAAKAERPEPAPIQTAAEPTPEGLPLKPAAEGPEPGSAPGVPALGTAKTAARGGALGNLDEVLQRRRA
ncbi:hypothetical protein SAT01_03370 [Sinomonas atrocyanea]|uniref:hypothetical protein n=1 Tax=Sinomonas atrocyanea TaxID=37927 RepID=UPI00114481E3|nr:hypothetical protein [Sinomonas atrocyanea]GEB62889.1 hypothetical protein SAT01_03370 [Sinomonas atrocyanea]